MFGSEVFKFAIRNEPIRNLERSSDFDSSRGALVPFAIIISLAEGSSLNGDKRTSSSWRLVVWRSETPAKALAGETEAQSEIAQATRQRTPSKLGNGTPIFAKIDHADNPQH
jgi:hypothetical protein